MASTSRYPIRTPASMSCAMTRWNLLLTLDVWRVGNSASFDNYELLVALCQSKLPVRWSMRSWSVLWITVTASSVSHSDSIFLGNGEWYDMQRKKTNNSERRLQAEIVFNVVDRLLTDMLPLSDQLLDRHVALRTTLSLSDQSERSAGRHDDGWLVLGVEWQNGDRQGESWFIWKTKIIISMLSNGYNFVNSYSCCRILDLLKRREVNSTHARKSAATVVHEGCDERVNECFICCQLSTYWHKL